jgi:hypothetical protein
METLATQGFLLCPVGLIEPQKDFNRTAIELQKNETEP